MVKPKNVFEAILLQGHDEYFKPTEKPQPTSHVPGSLAKIEELRRRLEEGQALHAEEDADFSEAAPGSVPAKNRDSHTYEKVVVKFWGSRVIRSDAFRKDC